MEAIKQPFNPIQIELLKIFSSAAVNEDDLKAIKKILVQYFANKTMNEADKIWDTNKWDKTKEQEFIHGHLRKPN